MNLRTTIGLRACLKTARGAAARDFGWGQGGEARASPKWAVRAEPTPAPAKRPAARRVFAGRAVWLCCSSVTDRCGYAPFVAPRHPALPAKTAPLGVFRQALRASLALGLFCIVATAVGGSDFPPLAGLPRGTPVVFGSGPAVPYGEWALTNVVKVDANRGYAAALRADGTVVRWGSLADDQVTPTLRSIVSISAGGAHTLALDADGRLHAWIAEGNVFQDQILPIPPGLGTVRKIAAGYSHSVVVDTAGRVWAWGANTHGAYDPPVWATNALEVTAGQLYCGLILEDRSVRGWFPPGWTATDGPPAGHAPAVQVDASIFGHVLSLREDGRVFA